MEVWKRGSVMMAVMNEHLPSGDVANSVKALGCQHTTHNWREKGSYGLRSDVVIGGAC